VFEKNLKNLVQCFNALICVAVDFLKKDSQQNASNNSFRKANHKI